LGIDNLQKEYEIQYGPGNYVPLVALTFWMFRIMVGVGLLMVAVAAYALFLPWKKWPDKWMGLLKWMVWVIPLPYLANTSGWILTESARQPWIVHGLLKTGNALSPNLTASMVTFSWIGFALTYAIFMVVDVYLLKTYAKTGLSADQAEAKVPAELDAGY
jgi:cytochrome d ubiquinol oxidase subunit I